MLVGQEEKEEGLVEGRRRVEGGYLIRGRGIEVGVEWVFESTPTLGGGGGGTGHLLTSFRPGMRVPGSQY